jgi:hypothetical protein
VPATIERNPSKKKEEEERRRQQQEEEEEEEEEKEEEEEEEGIHAYRGYSMTFSCLKGGAMRCKCR